MRKPASLGWSGVGLVCTLFLPACSAITEAAATTEPTALCANPAPLLGQFDPRVPGYIVQLQPGVAVQAEVGRLAAKYGFTPTHVYEFALQGFSAELSPLALASIRCEASVISVEHDAVYTFSTDMASS
jgi:hypothetical protein